MNKYNYPLKNGVSMPAMSLGTWDIRTEEQADRTVKAALNAGYGGIDTAACYENEKILRQAIERSGAERDSVTLTSKLWNNAHGYDKALQAFDESEKALGSIDVYLIHWPGPVSGFHDTWKAFEHLYAENRVKAVGVSNFQISQLEILLDSCEICPMINQIECHLRYFDQPLVEFCQSHEITVQGFSPLAAGTGLLKDPHLLAIAESIKRTPAQVALRYLKQRGVLPIPKSSNPERISENARIFDFTIPPSTMKELRSMNELVRTNKDPMQWFDQEYK